MRCDQLIAITITLMGFIIISGCTGTEEKIGSMTVIDSLDISDDIDHSLSFCSAINVYKDELFITDQDKFNVYDLNDFSFKRSFGKKGRSPGEYLGASDFLIENDTIYVCDMVNSRLQLLDITGNYIKSVKSQFPQMIEKWNDDIYVLSFNRMPTYTMWKYKNGILGEELKLGELREKSGFTLNNVEEMETNCILFNNDLLFIRYFFPDKFHILNDKGMFEEHQLTKTLANLKLNSMSTATVQNNKLYVVATHVREELINKDVEYTSSRQFKTAGISTEYLLIFNDKYEMERRYEFPVNSFTYYNTLVIYDDYIMVFDAGSDVIYRYRLEI